MYKKRHFKLAKQFDTKQQLQKYLKQHPEADPKNHSVKQKQENSLKKKQPVRKVDLTKTNENAGSNGQYIHQKQLSDEDVVTFADSTGNVVSKKVKQLSTEERQNVSETIRTCSLIHAQGFSDYSKVDKATFEKNKENILSFIENKKISLNTNTRETPVSARTENFIKQNRENLDRVIQKYSAGVRSPIAKKAIEDYRDKLGEVIRQACSKGGGMENVTEKDLDAFLQEDMKRLIYQEIQTRRRSMGDHGIRHLVGNALNSVDILNELQKGGVGSVNPDGTTNGQKITGKDKLLAMSTMVNHDIGYTLGQVALDAAKGGFHKSYSGQIALEEKDRYSKVFGEDGMQKMVGKPLTYSNGKPMLKRQVDGEWKFYKEEEVYDEKGNLKISQQEYQNCKIQHEKGKQGVIQYHDSSNYDWKNDPIGSSVALSDCTALFGKDKVQEFFFKNDDAMKEVTKIQCVMSTPDEVISKEQKQKIFEGFKKKMYGMIQNLQGATIIDKDLLQSQVKQMQVGKFSTIDDILTRSSGVLQGFHYDGNSNQMTVETTYSEQGNILQNMFGSDVVRNQWSKLYKDIKGSGRIEADNSGNQQLFRGNPEDKNESKILVKINGFNGGQYRSVGVAEVYQNVPSFAVKQQIARLSESVVQLKNAGQDNTQAVQKLNNFQKELFESNNSKPSKGEMIFGSNWKKVKELLAMAREGKDIGKELKNLGLTDKQKAYLTSSFVSKNYNRIAYEIAKDQYIKRMAIKMAQELIDTYEMQIGNLDIEFQTSGELKFLIKGHLYKVYLDRNMNNYKKIEMFIKKHASKLKTIKNEEMLIKFLDTNFKNYKRVF